MSNPYSGYPFTLVALANSSIDIGNFPIIQSVSQSGVWSLVDISGVISLPTGASTSVLQSIGNTTLTNINSKLPSNLTVSATRLLVDNSGIIQPISGTIAATQSGAWSTGRTWSLLNSTDSVNVGNFPASFSVSNFPAIQPASQSGVWNINNISGTISLPTGAATTLLQSTANTSLSSIDTKLPSNLTVSSTRLLVDNSGVTQPISGAVTSNQGGAWSTGRTWILSNATDLVASVQSGTWNINNLSGTVSLPTGASTSALQSAANTSLSNIDSNTSATSSKLPATLGQKTMANSMAMVIASDQSALPTSQSGIWNINNLSGTVSLPTGASTVALQSTGNTSLASIDGKLTSVSTSTLQTTGNTSLASIDGKLTSLGQKAMAASMPVVIASNQSAVPASQSGNWSTRTQDGAGNLLTSQVNGAQRALDIGINVAGVQIDPRTPNRGSLTNRSGTATAASTQIMAANATRNYLYIQNSSGTAIWINFTTAATAAAPSIQIAANAVLEMNGSGFITTEAINVIRGGILDTAFAAKEG